MANLRRAKYGNRKVTTPDQKSPLEKFVAKAKREQHELALLFQVRESFPQYLVQAQYQWHPNRKYKSDVAIPKVGLLIECDGGLYVNGGHTRGQAREDDYERDAEALMLGWKVLRCSPRHVQNGKALEWVRVLLS